MNVLFINNLTRVETVVLQLSLYEFIFFFFLIKENKEQKKKKQ